MKNSIIYSLYRIYVNIIKFLSKDVLNTRLSCNSLLFQKIYLNIIKNFNDEKIKEQHKLATYVYNKIWDNDVNIESIHKEKLDELANKILSEESHLIAMNYILTAYYYYTNSTKIFASIFYKDIRIKLKEARKYSSDIKLLRKEDYLDFKKDITQNYKLNTNKIKKYNKQKLEEEKDKIIKPITISTSNVIFIFTIISGLSLSGGIIYNQLFFYLLDINASYFFNLSDYLSSTMDTITITFLTILIASPFALLRVSHILDEQIHDEQFGSKVEARNDKFESRVKIFIFFSIIMNILVIYYINKTISSTMIATLIYFLIIIYLPKLSLWKYVKNPFSVNLSVLVLLVFFYLIITKAYTQVEDLRNNNFNPEYKVFLKNTTNGNSDSTTYILSNSTYTFLYNNVTKKVKITHNNEIDKIEVISDKNNIVKNNNNK